MNWYDTFNDVFFISLTTIILGVVSLSIRTCLKSKCDKFDCLCVHIHRNVDAEVELEEQNIRNIPMGENPV